MISLQDILAKTQKQAKAIQEVLDRGFYHPEEASLYEGLSRADYHEVKETLDSISLAELLAKSGASTSAGLQGSNYLVAAKTYDTLVGAAKTYDIAPLVSSTIVTKWEGGDLKVPVAVDGNMRIGRFSGGGRVAEGGDTWTYTTLTPYLGGINISIGNDLLEDNAYELIQRQVEHAGEAAGRSSSEMVMARLTTANGGDGTINTSSAGSDETTWQHIMDGSAENEVDGFVSDTLVCTLEAWSHSAHAYAVVASSMVVPCVTTSLPAQGFHFKVNMLDVLLYAGASMHASTDTTAFTDCKSFVLDRKNALITARKRWLQMENYAEPLRDLVNCVVTFRQDVGNLYQDATCTVTET